MLIPPVMMILTLAWMVVWISLAVHVYAIGEIAGVPSEDPLEVTKFYGACTLTDE